MIKFKVAMKISLIACCVLLAEIAQALAPVQHWTTSQGSRVYFVPAPDLPMLDVSIVFDAGSARDADKAGLAAFTSRLIGEGAGGLSADTLAERFDDLGASWGTTSGQDMAVLSLRSLSDAQYLKPALETLALVLSQADFPAKAIERVRKGFLQSLEYQKQSPASLASLAFFKALYGDHPYGSSESGTEESIKSLQYADVKKFYQQYYVANNALITLVGAIETQQARAIAEQLSLVLKKGTKPAALPPLPPAPAAQHIHIDYPSVQTHVLLGQIGYARGHADHFALYLGNYILGGGGLVSLLVDEIREKRGYAYSVHSGFSPIRLAGAFIASLQTKNAQRDDAVKVLRQTLKDYLKTGPDDKAVTSAINNRTGSFPLGLDSNAKISGFLGVMGFYDLPLDYLHVWTDKIRTVTPQQIQQAMRGILEVDKMILVTVGGQK